MRTERHAAHGLGQERVRSARTSRRAGARARSAAGSRCSAWAVRRVSSVTVGGCMAIGMKAPAWRVTDALRAMDAGVRPRNAHARHAVSRPSCCRTRIHITVASPTNGGRPLCGAAASFFVPRMAASRVPAASGMAYQSSSVPSASRRGSLQALARGEGPRGRSDQSRSNRSRFITLSHAATKSSTNFRGASSLA